MLNPDNPIVQELSLAFSQEHRLTFIQNMTYLKKVDTPQRKGDF